MNNYPPQFITKHINKRTVEIRKRNNNLIMILRKMLERMNVNSKASRTYQLLADICRKYSS